MGQFLRTEIELESEVFTCPRCAPHLESSAVKCEDCQLLEEYSYEKSLPELHDQLVLAACFKTLKSFSTAQTFTPGHVGFKRSLEEFEEAEGELGQLK